MKWYKVDKTEVSLIHQPRINYSTDYFLLHASRDTQGALKALAIKGMRAIDQVACFKVCLHAACQVA